MKILIPVDGSGFTKRMLAFLLAHDEWFGGQHQYTLVNVSAPVPPRAASVLDKATLASYYADESAKVFKPIQTFFSKQKVQAEYLAKVGPVAQTISDLASKGKFEMVMMGSHGHSALGNLVLGSVTNKVLAHCEKPVLIVR